MRPGRNADRPGSTHIQVRFLELAAVIENLNSPVAPVANVDIALRVGREGVRRIELSGLGASRSPGLDEHTVLVELRDARVAIAIRNENVACGIPRHVGWP